MIRFPPKKILVAYDLSDVSRTAWKHAAALGKECGAALEVVYVEPWQGGVDVMPPTTLTPAGVAELRGAISAKVGEGVKVNVLHGDPARRIIAHARLHRPDMIVVGTRGRKGLKRALLGSTAEAVIRSSPVPVLAARGSVRDIRSILAPVNFTPYAEHGFAYAAAAAAVLSAQLKVLHVTDDPVWSGNLQYRLSNLIHRLPGELRKRCRAQSQAAVGGAVKGILKAMRGQDWIVLVAHRKSLLKDAFLGTTLEQVLRRSTIPVLAVPLAHRAAHLLVAGGKTAGRERSLSLK
ncbi:MAG: universal stress protein [Elusimicrobiota bacterium]|nr:universal stress protein [Elusimicrobiota bacterium]